MPWHENVERWRQYVEYEARDVPAGLVLAIIEGESAGIPGAKGFKPLVGARLPKDDGTTAEVFTPLGLMQIAPVTVAAYNAANTPPVTIDDLTGTDQRAARQQIRVGCWVFASEVNRLHRWDKDAFPGASPGSATADQIKIALAMYGAGSGPVIDALDALRQKKRPLTFDELFRAPQNPRAGGGAAYAAKRWASFSEHEADAAARIERKNAEKKDGLGFGFIGIILAYFAWRYFQKKRQEPQNERLLTA